MKGVEITKKITERIAELAQKHGLGLVLMFGSQARDKVHPESDIDVAYLPSAGVKVDDVEINYDLTLIFGTDNIDTSNLSYAPPLLQRRIIDEAVVIYDRTGHEFSAFEVAAIRRYAEAKPLFEIRREKLGAFLQSA